MTDRWVGHSPKIACESTKFKDFDHSYYTWYMQRDKVHVGARTQIDKNLEYSIHTYFSQIIKLKIKRKAIVPPLKSDFISTNMSVTSDYHSNNTVLT